MSTTGNDTGISTLSPSQIQIMGKAQFMNPICCIGRRTYFLVLENAVESNYPPYGCTCIPTCCDEPDIISKTYYDRGPWNFCPTLRCIGCISGPPKFFGHNPKRVCLCMDCPQLYNDLMAGSIPCLCGDRVHYVPYETCCCGMCSTTATGCSSCFGLCGVKAGEPLVTIPLVSCLLPGSGDQLSEAINNARASWSARTGKH